MNEKAEPNLLAIGAWVMFAAVACGAFGAHALRDMMTVEGRAVYQTGVHYHLAHGLAILALGVLQRGPIPPKVAAVGWLFVIGTVLFSGSLYVLGVTGIKLVGLITPFGGVCYLVGWFLLASSARLGSSRA